VIAIISTRRKKRAKLANLLRQHEQSHMWQSCNEESSKISGEGWIHDFVASFGVNNRPIYMALCSQSVWGGPFDTVSRPSVVDDWCRFPIYNRFFTATSQKLFKESSLQLWHVTCQVNVFLRFFLLQMSIATCDCRIQHTLGNVFHDKVLLILQGSRFCCKIKCNIVNPPKAVIN